ncbi:UNVERIFIED_CONTAM: Thioredoxin O1, mitochondrial [Sesamum radiatum]|uniref:Thioredoxin O1, mitochondrial n=1 Tax=Sesamum radiatum TaxID=300843 RepID=A0AAW2T0H5_SESRA
MRGASAILRRLVSGRSPCRFHSSISDHLILSSALAASCSPLILPDVATPFLLHPPRYHVSIPSPQSLPKLLLCCTLLRCNGVSAILLFETKVFNLMAFFAFIDIYDKIAIFYSYMPSILLSLWLSVTDPSNVVSIESEQQFNDSLRKMNLCLQYSTSLQFGADPIVVPYNRAAECEIPHVTTYKIDIDKEGLGSALSKLNIHAVPTLHFFQNGKKANEVIGADVQRLKDIMEALYK